MVTVEEVVFQLSGKDALSPIFSKNTDEVQTLSRTTQNLGETLDKVMQEGLTKTNQMAEAVATYNAQLEISNRNIVGGLNPALQGIDTSRLEQLGIKMEVANANTELVNRSVQAFGTTLDQAMQEGEERVNNASIAVKQFNGYVETGVANIKGLTPAMMGIDTSRLEQMGVDMENVKNKTDDAKKSVDDSTKSWDTFKLAVGGALSMAGMYMTTFMEQSVTLSSTIQSQMDVVTAAYGMPLTDTDKVDSDLIGMTKKTGWTPEQLAQPTANLAVYTHGNYNQAESLLPYITAIADTKSMDPQKVSQMLGMAVGGQSTALKRLGIDLQNQGISNQQFSSENVDTRIAQIEQAINGSIDVSKVNQTYLKSPAGQLALFNSELQELQEKLGQSVLPLLIQIMNFLEPIIGFVSGNKALSDLTAIVLIIATLATTIGGPLLILKGLNVGSIFGNISGGAGKLKDRLSGIPSPIATSNKYLDLFITKIIEVGEAANLSSGGGRGKGKGGAISAEEEGIVNLPNGQSYRTGSKGKESPKFSSRRDFWGFGEEVAEDASKGGRLSGLKGKFSGLSGLLGDEKGMIGAGRGIVAAGEEGGGILSKLGGLGRLGGLAGRVGLDAIPGLGELAMAGTAAYGAYSGWTSTQGNWGDKGKAAVGGAVDSLTMGLIPKNDVVSGLNWMYSQFTQAKPKMQQLGSLVIQGLETGIKSQLGPLGDILQIVSDHFPKSPPKLGPLAEITQSNMQNWTSGISDAGLLGFKKLSDGVGGTLPGKTGSGVVQHVHYHEHGPITIDASHLSTNELMSMLIYLNETALKPTTTPNPIATTNNGTTTNTTSNNSTTTTGGQ